MDFASMTDEQIIHYLSQSTEKICGRLRSSQINRLMTVVNERKHAPHLQKLAAAVLLASATTNAFGSDYNSINTQSIEKIGTTIDADTTIRPTKSAEKKVPTKNTIKGVVRDFYTNEPILFAHVYIKNTEIATTTNEFGQFELSFLNDSTSNKIILTTESIGFEEKESRISKTDFPLNLTLDIKLEHSEIMIMGEIEFHPEPKK